MPLHSNDNPNLNLNFTDKKPIKMEPEWANYWADNLNGL